MELVPGRQCGACSMCCIDLHINTPELKKLAGLRCEHLRSDGCCAIYETRYRTCRDFNCGWRAMAELGDDWRPDRSGIALIPNTKNNPPGYRGEAGVQIMLLRRDAIQKAELPGLIAAWVGARVPLHLTIKAPVGYHAKTAFLNPMAEDAVRRRDRAALVKVLEEMYDALERQRPVPADLATMPVSPT